MTKKFNLIFLLITASISAQIPANYYNNTQGLTGYALKTALYEILAETHNPQPYSNHWSFFEMADVKENGTVWDIYADCDFQFGIPANGGNQDIGIGGNLQCEYFNREHTFPTSWFGGNIEPMRSDVMHIYPADKLVNNERGNLPFALVGNATFTSSNGSKKGTSNMSGVDGNVFEIVDEYKGDIARSFFYMATRYENFIANWVNNNPDGAKMLNGSSAQAYQEWAIDLLLTWHYEDPVSQKEIDRNNAAYQFQGNRNPFIDHPEFACQIWNFDICETLNITEQTITNLFTIYPNPSREVINIESKELLQSIEVININGQLVQKINPKTTNYTVSNLKSGFYILKLATENSQTTMKLIVN
jgi:endonuclease I